MAIENYFALESDLVKQLPTLLWAVGFDPYGRQVMPCPCKECTRLWALQRGVPLPCNVELHYQHGYFFMYREGYSCRGLSIVRTAVFFSQKYDNPYALLREWNAMTENLGVGARPEVLRSQCTGPCAHTRYVPWVLA